MNALHPELYKRTIGETMDGVIDVTVKKPTIDELNVVAEKILMTTKTVSASALEISKVQGDVRSAGVLKVAKATKALIFSKEANTLLGTELAFQTKLIKNLVATIKSSDNL